MAKLNLLIPLTKADAKQRLVYGIAAAETPDKSGEIMDYATAKPAIQKWSETIQKQSQGASLGNVRLMHKKEPVGKVVEMAFDDDAKSVAVCVKVVDDATWKLVEEGVVSAFSIGGGYGDRWPDPQNPALKRYTPIMSELSLVDNPCIPNAVITMVKADGVEETIAIKATGALSKVAETDPETDEALAKLNAALAKAAMAAAAPKPYGDVEYADPENGKYPIDTAAHIRAAWSYVNMPKNAEKLGSKVGAVKAKIEAAWKDKIDRAGPPSMEKMDAIVALACSDAGLKLAKHIDDARLAKGFSTVSRVSELMCQLSSIAQSVMWEENCEQDTDSKLPQMALDQMASMKTWLIEMINEETMEFMQDCERAGGDCIALLAPCFNDDGSVMEMAAPVFGLHKADTVLLEKMGARTSKTDMKHIQASHDHMMSLGAKCDAGNCDKAAPVDDLAKAESARLRKAVAGAAEQIDQLADQLAKANAAMVEQAARIARLEAAPAPPKGMILTAIPKDQDDRGVPVNGFAKAADPRDLRGKPIVFSDDPLERMHQARALLNGVPAPGSY